MTSNSVLLPVRDIYFASNGAATLQLLNALRDIIPYGCIAAELLRLQKASSRAKDYRGGIERSDGNYNSYRHLAYQAKAEALTILHNELNRNSFGLCWGWGIDPAQKQNPNVLFVDLPNGQVSFHSPQRMSGPDYELPWYGQESSEDRIISFCQKVLDKEFSGAKS